MLAIKVVKSRMFSPRYLLLTARLDGGRFAGESVSVSDSERPRLAVKVVCILLDTSQQVRSA
jgi:hypothetical protein